jgi:hypothetical protein
MKRVTLFGIAAMAVLILGSTSIMKSQDMGVVAWVDPYANGQIYPNLPVQLTWTVQNFSSSPLTTAQADTVYIDFEINGSLVRSFFFTPTSIPFAGNTSLNIWGITPFDWATAGLGNGTQSVTICATSRVMKNGVSVDVNSANDGQCITVTYSGDNSPLTYDLSVSPNTVRVSNPAYNPGSNIPTGKILSEIEFFLKNEGSGSIPAGLDIEYTVTMKGVQYGPIVFTTPAISSPGSVPVAVEALTEGIFWPSTNGAFDICVKLVPNSDDTDHSNDEDCSSYTYGPVGIEEAESNSFEMYFNSNELHVNMLEEISGVCELNITSVNGQLVKTEVLNADDTKSHTVQMNDLNAGLYIANITSSNGLSKSLRVVVN